MGHGERFQVEICHFFGFCNWLLVNTKSTCFNLGGPPFGSSERLASRPSMGLRLRLRIAAIDGWINYVPMSGQCALCKDRINDKIHS